MLDERVIHFNWVQHDDPNGRGGGVSVYLGNLLRRCSERRGVLPTGISSGLHYGVLWREPFYRIVSVSAQAPLAEKIEVINSPVKAPAHDMFYDIRDWTCNERVADVFEQLLVDRGPFDTVIFHSVEGVSSQVLALVDKFPHLKFIYMWHNYMPVCPQIELLYQNSEPCENFEEGRKCQACLYSYHTVNELILPQRLGSLVEKLGLDGTPLGNLCFSAGLGAGRIARAIWYFLNDVRHKGLAAVFERGKNADNSSFMAIDRKATTSSVLDRGLEMVRREASDYVNWRATNVAMLNKFFAHLCVSKQVAEKITSLGINGSKVFVTPLAMDIHATPELMRATARLKTPNDDFLRVSFIGYGIPSKGLPFLTTALMNFPSKILMERVELTVFARLGPLELRRLMPLKTRVARLRVVNGYKRRELAAIARTIDLNIVPSIWWETYNQVAHELLCLGTPSLLSSTVGISMHYKDKEAFVFERGNEKDCVRKLEALVSSRKLLDSFWDDPPVLPTMDEHIDLLSSIVNGDLRSNFA